MSTLLKFYWAEDVRRIRVAELTYDQVKMACLRIYAEKLAPEDEDAFHLEFWNDGQHHLVTAGTFSDLVLLHLHQQLEHQQSGVRLPLQRSLRLLVVEHPRPQVPHLLQVKAELEDIPAPSTPDFLPAPGIQAPSTPDYWTRDALREPLSPQTPETPYPAPCTPVKEEDLRQVKVECEELPAPFQEKANQSVRKAARAMLKQVRRQREASRRKEKKAARNKRKARCKVLKRMEKAAKLAARRLTRRRDKEKSLKRTEAWRSEAEEEEHEEDEELEPPQAEASLEDTKQMRKERKKAAKRLLKFAKRARKLRKKGGSCRGEELTAPEQELQQMVRNAEVAFEGLFRDDLASVV